MKDALEAIGLILVFIAMRLGRLVWLILKAALFAAIVFGALGDIGENVPLIPDSQLASRGLLEAIETVFMIAMDNWSTIGLALLFFWVWGAKTDLDKLRSDATQTKMAIVAMMNYLELEVQTEASKTFRERGMRGLWKEGMELFWAKLLIGHDRYLDDALTSKPTRYGKVASFADDLEQQIRDALKHPEG